MAYAKRYVVVNTIAYAITATIVYVIVNAIVNANNKLSNLAINKTR